MSDPQNDPMIIAGREFNSRLIIGTGKFKDYAENAAALDASGADMVTVLARELGGWNLVKLEVLSNVHLYPDMAETLASLKLLSVQTRSHSGTGSLFSRAYRAETICYGQLSNDRDDRLSTSTLGKA